MKKNRIASIDTLRIFTILGVITAHVNTYYGYWNTVNWPENVKAILNAIACLGTPTFFMISGYLFAQSFAKTNNILATWIKFIKRLSFVFIAWTLIYAIPHLNATTWVTIKYFGFIHAYFWNLQYITRHPLTFLLTGGTWHLWYIVGSMTGLTATTFFIHFKQEKLLLYIGLLFYAFSPLINLYIPPDPNNGYAWSPVIRTMMSLAPLSIGWWLSSYKKYSPQIAFMLILTGFGFFTFKDTFLFHFFKLNASYASFDLLLMAMGLMILALHRPTFASNTVFPYWGQMTLGVFCSHILVLNYLKDSENFFIPIFSKTIWHILLPFIVYFLALAISYTLKNIPLTRRIVY